MSDPQAAPPRTRRAAVVGALLTAALTMSIQTWAAGQSASGVLLVPVFVIMASAALPLLFPFFLLLGLTTIWWMFTQVLPGAIVGCLGGAAAGWLGASAAHARRLDPSPRPRGFDRATGLWAGMVGCLLLSGAAAFACGRWLPR